MFKIICDTLFQESEIIVEAMREMVFYTERIFIFGSNGTSDLYKGRWLGNLPLIG